jgi:hypothetical protein
LALIAVIKPAGHGDGVGSFTGSWTRPQEVTSRHIASQITGLKRSRRCIGNFRLRSAVSSLCWNFQWGFQGEIHGNRKISVPQTR